MDQEFDDDEVLTNKEILSKLWLYPRSTFRYLNDNYYNKQMPILQTMGWLAIAADLIAVSEIFFGISQYVFIASFFGWILFAALAALISLTGRWWLQGEAGFGAVARIMIYACVPYFISCFFTHLIMKNEEIGLLTFCFLLVKLVLVGWTCCIMVIGVSEVQNISNRRAAFNIAISVLILAAGCATIFWTIAKTL